MTIYGLYAREGDGWFSVSTLIRLMAELGVDEPAVRSSISRLKRRGILLAHSRDGVAGYELAPSARSIFDEGDRRIFARPRASVDKGWLLAVFSVPESQRARRHALRSRLSWLGFGTVAAGVWIAPAHLEAETRDVLDRDHLAPYVDLFRADHVAFGDLRALVDQWWDLRALQSLYDDFLATYTPVRAAWRRRRSTAESAPGNAFADYVQALTSWRRLPYLDPGLPDDVLPKGWTGTRAAELFLDLRERLAGPAKEFVAAIR